jgi:hypothetical protein
MDNISICLKAHNGIGNHPCAICSKNTTLIGVDFFLEGTWDAVCYNCARQHAEPGLLLAWVAYTQKQSEIMGLISHAETLADGEDRVRIVTQLANRVIARITEPELVQDDLKTLVRLAAQESNAQMKQYFLATVDALQEAIEDMNQDKP